jgi:hypothetical protein
MGSLRARSLQRLGIVMRQINHAGTPGGARNYREYSRSIFAQQWFSSHTSPRGNVHGEVRSLKCVPVAAWDMYKVIRAAVCQYISCPAKKFLCCGICRILCLEM